MWTASALVTGSYDFDDAEIAGWGWAGEGVNEEGSLRVVNAKIWPQYFCEDVIADAPGIFQRNVKPSGICKLSLKDEQALASRKIVTRPDASIE